MMVYHDHVAPPFNRRPLYPFPFIGEVQFDDHVGFFHFFSSTTCNVPTNLIQFHYAHFLNAGNSIKSLIDIVLEKTQRSRLITLALMMYNTNGAKKKQQKYLQI